MLLVLHTIPPLNPPFLLVERELWPQICPLLIPRTHECGLPWQETRKWSSEIVLDPLGHCNCRVLLRGVQRIRVSKKTDPRGPPLLSFLEPL